AVSTAARVFAKTLHATADLVCPAMAEASLAHSLVCEKTVPPSHNCIGSDTDSGSAMRKGRAID
ncbi:MAG: hypothetical protein V3U02_11825, partial [Calditrichia bacterium]